MTKSYNLLKYLVLTCLLIAAFPASANCTTTTPLLEPASFVSNKSYQLAKTWFLPDWQSDTRSYNTSSGSDDKGGGDAEKTCETYGYASPGKIDLSLYDCSDYDIKPLYGLECYTGCVCKPKFQYDDDNCDIAAGYTLSGSSCGGKYESCVCSGKCCSDSMCGSNQSCVNNVCEDNCATLPSGWQELPCADADLQTDTMDNECGGYYYKCSTAQAYCEEHGYSKDTCDNGVVQDTCDKDGSYVKCQECNVMKAGWQETPCSDPDLQSGKEDNGCGGYYYQCMSTGEYCESKGFKKQECEAGEEATVCDKDSSYKTCACVPLSDESNCSWGTKNCDNACGGTRSCCKTAAEYCTEKGFKQQTCSSTDIVTKCEADSSYVQCGNNPDCQVTPVTVPANGYCSSTNSCDICTDWKCNTNYYQDGSSCKHNDCKATPVSVPSNGYCSNTNSCNICTNWSCNTGYNQSGSTCICATNCKDKVTYKPENSSYTREECIACGQTTYINVGWTCNNGYADTESHWCSVPETTDCGELGYNKTEEDCEGLDMLKCPFDMSHVWCEDVPVEPEPGMILYSDGTVSLDVISGKTPVGVVAYVDETRRFAVALEETMRQWGGYGYDVSCLTTQAQSDFNGAANTQCLINDSQSHPAAEYCNTYKPVSSGTGSNGWYLPAGGELSVMSFSYGAINLGLQKLSKTQLSSNWYWSSSESNNNYARYVRPSGGLNASSAKNNYNRVRCVLAF